MVDRQRNGKSSRSGALGQSSSSTRHKGPPSVKERDSKLSKPKDKAKSALNGHPKIRHDGEAMRELKKDDLPKKIKVKEEQMKPKNAISPVPENYEEDFEDYESDFEEDGEDTTENKQKVPEAERHNKGKVALPLPEQESLLLKRLATANKDSSRSEARSSEKNTQNKTNELPFVLPEKREFAMGIGTEQKQPSADVEIGSRKDWLLDYFHELAGAKEDRKQDWSQTEGPSLDIGSQTEPAEFESKGIQSGKIHSEDEDLRNNDNDVYNKQPQRLARFVSEAGQLMASLLNPNFRKAPMLASSALNNSNLEFSNHFSSLSLNSLFKENRLCAVAFGCRQNICLFVFIPSSDGMDGIRLKCNWNADPTQSRRSFAAEFDIFDGDVHLREHERMFCCDHEVALLRYSPDASVLFAALKDGSLVGWDLQRGAAHPLNGSKLKVPVLMPSVNSAFEPFIESSVAKLPNGTHWADLAIVGMEVMEGAMGSRTIARIVLLYESGLMACWSALLDTGTDALRLMPIFSTRCLTKNGTSAKGQLEFISCFCLHQATAFIGTSKGRIFSMDVAAVKGDNAKVGIEYTADQEGNNEVTCLKIGSPLLLAATTDQRIFLFNVSSHNQSEPVKVLRPPLMIGNSAVKMFSAILLEWSPSVADIFYSVHEGERVITWRKDRNERGEKWDFKISEFYPEFRAKIQECVCWSDRLGNPYMALRLSNGEAQVHHLK